MFSILWRSQPIVSSPVAVALGMDQFGVMKGGATALIFVGVYIVTTSKSYAQLQAEKATKNGRIVY